MELIYEFIILCFHAFDETYMSPNVSLCLDDEVLMLRDVRVLIMCTAFGHVDCAPCVIPAGS